ncbi:MAG: hypothetical protein LR005_00410 [Candidatus Pacebacteria bacterium]|nr:hypothetical protein [Candidatus Paceibacterota bacterium]
MKKISLTIIVILLAVIAAGMYKFNYLANKEGYNVDGNKINQLEKDNLDLQNQLDDLNQEDLNQDIENGEIETEECIGEFCDGDGSEGTQGQTTINIPLIFGQGNIGCGVGMAFMPYSVPQTTGVMGATYEKLFSLSYEPLNTYRNTLHGYNQLEYQSVSLVGGVAKVYLTGNMYGPGHCAEPEMRAQISQAALQFPTVNTVEVYLNGSLFDWCELSDADVSESHCDTTPRYWIDN